MQRSTLLLAGAITVGLVAVVWLQDQVEQPTPAPLPTKSLPPSPYGNCVIRSLNNQVLNFSRRVEAGLRNPDSFEHVSTEVGPVENGVFGVVMTYRATNGFGAVDTGVAMGEVRVHDCAPKLVSMN